VQAAPWTHNSGGEMTWLFTRKKDVIRLETWYDKHTSEFVVDFTHPDGQLESKRFVNNAVFHTWLAVWDGQLAAQGWKQSGPFLSAPEQHASDAVQAGTSDRLPQACIRCGSQRTRIVGQSGTPPLIHRRCEDCGHLSSQAVL